MDKKVNKIENLLEELAKGEYLTAEVIADELGVSTKTARTRMGELNALIFNHGAEIISRPRYGFCLQVNDKAKWDQYFRSGTLAKKVKVGSQEERTTYIALKLLMSDDYIKINQFSDELYVSNQIISDSLKECENHLKYYKLNLIRKPYYGLKITGAEFDKRNYIISRFQNDFKSFVPEELDKEYDSEKVFSKVLDALLHHRIHLVEVSLQSTVAYVYLSLIRHKMGIRIIEKTTISEEDMKDRAFAAAADIIYSLNPKMDDAEVYYLGVYISAMRSNDAIEFHTNVVITQKIDQLVHKIFTSINRVIGVDFTSDLRLHMMLAQHLMALDLRIRYHIPLECDSYTNIRKNFSYAYTIANEAVAVLAKEYNLSIADSEVDWLTLIFATGLHDINKTYKMNVLVVCQEGRASSQLLKYEIQKNYSNYVNEVKVCTTYELETFDLSNIDYIFSTVNIPIQTNIPILMVLNLGLFQKDLTIENELLGHRIQALDHFFSEDMFFTDVKGETKEEILYNLCQNISSKKILPAGFYEALLEREELNSTDYSPMIAIPHPSNLIPDDDIVAVAILDKPINWGRYSVQILLLTALTLKNEDLTQLFYQVTSHFVVDKKSISKLIKKPTFKTFVGLISQAGM